MIPYENLKKLNEPFEQAFTARFQNLLQSGWYILGNEVKQFEEAFAQWHQVPFVVGVANGLDALVLSLKACNFPENAEVIVPSNTYVASILAIIQAGLKPVLVEPNIQSYNIDPALIEQSITTNTKAIMVVHLYGKCCNMQPIMALCEQYQLKLIEDCAQAHGATYKNQLAGTFGNFAAFSFYPTKNLGALGDAGAIICKTEQDYQLLKQLRNYGSSVKYHNEVVGFNSRLDEIQATFLSVKLPYLNEINAHKRAIAQLYNSNLNRSKYILPDISQTSMYFDVYHIYNVRTKKRDALKAHLLAHNIQTEIHYPIPPHQQNALKSLFQNQSFPIAEIIHQTTLSLPCSFAHSLNEIETVIEVMNAFDE
ncbi:MAG: DegT/DnrJ/EryC1/StrS family aminotransferase [Chitinophagaceae bacterium]